MKLKYIINALLLLMLFAALGIACAGPGAAETASVNVSTPPVIESAAGSSKESFNASAPTSGFTSVGSAEAAETLELDDPKVTTAINYQSSLSLLNKSQEHTFSPDFTDEQIFEIAQKLGVPDNIEVEIEVGDQYYWEDAGIYIAEVSFYRGNTLVAGAECEVNTSNLARSIYNYDY